MSVALADLEAFARSFRIVRQQAGPLNAGRIDTAGLAPSTTGAVLPDSVTGAGVPVRATVNWDILREDGATQLAAQAEISATHILGMGDRFFSTPTGTDAPTFSFAFPPILEERTWQTLQHAMMRRNIRARIRLSAGPVRFPVDGSDFALPLLAIDVPRVQVPTVVVLFQHRDFHSGAAFVVVPNDSPIRGLSGLQHAVTDVQERLDDLRGVVELASFLAGLNALSSLLPDQPHVQLRVADASNSYNNFNDVTLIQKAWWQNDTEAEDELSSLVFVGAPPQSVSSAQRRGGARVQLFNARHRKTGEGHLTLEIGGLEMHAIIRDLHPKTPVTVPASTKVAAVKGGFGDKLSSLHFPKVA